MHLDEWHHVRTFKPQTKLERLIWKHARTYTQPFRSRDVVADLGVSLRQVSLTLGAANWPRHFERQGNISVWSVYPK